MFPKTIKAAILVEQKKPLVVADIQLPKKLSFGQVLVKIFYSTICGSQLNEIDGAKGPDTYLPHLLGHEGSAEVRAVGEGVKHVKKGDSVVLHWRQGAGIQCDPPIYRKGKQVINAGWVTTFQEYAVVSENRMTKIPSDFPKKLAPLFGCAVTTAMGVVNNDAQIKIGQSVVVFGSGGVGLSIIQAASMVSAYPIVAIDIIDAKLKMAKRFGATHIINSSSRAERGDLYRLLRHSVPRNDVEATIRSIAGENGADVVIDTTGNTRVIEQSYNLTHPDGKTILVGVPKKGDTVSIYTLPLHFKKILKGSHGGCSEPDIDIPRLIRLYQAGKLKFDGMITHEFPLKDINKAIATVRSGVAGRVLITIQN